MYLSDVTVTEDGPSAGYAIEVDGLRKCYGDRTVLERVDFTVRQGEVFALLGPNGAGKTTTVEILFRVSATPPQDGAGSRERPGPGGPANSESRWESSCRNAGSPST